MSPADVDLFCKSVYAIGFMDCSCPISAATSGVETEVRSKEEERVCNSIQQYFGDMFEDPDQVWRCAK